MATVGRAAVAASSASLARAIIITLSFLKAGSAGLGVSAAGSASKAAIASAFPLVIQAAAAHNLSWAVMYDTSSKGADWGRNDRVIFKFRWSF